MPSNEKVYNKLKNELFFNIYAHSSNVNRSMFTYMKVLSHSQEDVQIIRALSRIFNSQDYIQASSSRYQVI